MKDYKVKVYIKHSQNSCGHLTLTARSNTVDGAIRKAMSSYGWLHSYKIVSVTCGNECVYSLFLNTALAESVNFKLRYSQKGWL